MEEDFKSNNNAVILLSGGMDSLVTLSYVIKDGFIPCALHVSYGQRTSSRELVAFNNICDFYGISNKLVTDISYLTQIGGSSLTDHTLAIPNSDLTRRTVPNTYVPFRNAHLISIAVSWSEILQAKRIYIGAVQEDAVGYPDCRKIFFRTFEKLIQNGTNVSITIETPVIHFSKSKIVTKGIEHQVPFHLSWSCYQSQDMACGKCDSCAFRLRGFKEANVMDPIPYKNINI